MVYTDNGILLSHKKEQNNIISATWMELETLILSEMSQKDKDRYHMISLITGIEYPAQMNLSTEKKIMDSENRIVAARRREGGSGRDWKFGVNRCKLLLSEWIYNEILLCSIENYV